MSKIKAYVSHSIRGKMGKEATDEYMEENNLKAIAFGNELRKAFPNIDFYIPGDHDEFVCIAYKEKYINEKQILWIDCQIINSRNFVLAWSPDDFISNGMRIEIEHAHLHNIRVLVVKDINDAKSIINHCLNALKR